MASIRLALSDVVNTEDLAEQMNRILQAIERLDERISGENSERADD